MSEAAFPWAPLAVSRTRALLAALAVATTVTVLVLVAAARFLDTAELLGSPAWFAAGSGVATLLGFRARRVVEPAVEIRIDWRGRIGIRSPDGEVEARPEYIGAWLIVLLAGRRRVVVWRDTLAPDQFRKLSAIARWRIERSRLAELDKSDTDRAG